MTSIYLINNSLTLNNLSFPEEDSLEKRREKRILSIEGEEESRILASSNKLAGVNVIYSSPFVMALETAKYLAKKLDLNINIDSHLGERKIGNIGTKKISFITEMQENDFDFCLQGGEALNDVKTRMYAFIKTILNEHKNKEIALFTHNVAITSLLSNWCTKGFNLDNRLILNYGEDAIIDGTWDGITVIKLVFNDENELISIEK